MKRRSSIQKIAVCLAVILFAEAIFPSMAMALTSGPNQPEFSGFNTIGVDQVVDHFTGDLNYTIPLFEVPGVGGSYPLSLTYNSEVRMETEASMVGYGWNLNIGQITRNVSGIPDDFNGEKVGTKKSIRKNWTVGFKPLGVGVEFVNLGLGLSIDPTFLYNNYKGFGYDVGLGIQFKPVKSGHISGSFNLGFSSFEGTRWDAGLDYGNFNSENKFESVGGLSLGGNSFSGITALNYNYGPSYGNLYEKRLPIYLGEDEYTGFNFRFGVRAGLELPIFINPYLSSDIFYSEQVLESNGKWKFRPTYGCNNAHHLSSLNDHAAHDYADIGQSPITQGAKTMGTIAPSKDVYSVNANGLSGTFTSMRNDVGVFTKPNSNSSTVGDNATLKLAAGATSVKAGAIVTFPFTISGYNTRQGAPYTPFDFTSKDNSSEIEPFYFKFKDEHTADIIAEGYDLSQTDEYLGEDRPVARTVVDGVEEVIPVLNVPLTIKEVTADVEDENGEGVSIGDGTRNVRKIRTRSIEHYSNQEIVSNPTAFPRQNNVSILRHIHPEGNVSIGTDEHLNQDEEDRPVFERNMEDGQIAAMTVRDEDGTMWNFDLPVLNHLKRDVAYAVTPQDEEHICSKIVHGSFTACPANDRLGGAINHEVATNENPSDELLSITETPAHAINHLLTSVLGYNYVDINQNGPDDGDFGHWIKFSYVQTGDEDSPFAWRMPFSGGNYNAGSRLIPDDDRAFFTYGERDQYYIEKIESPTHVAWFDYSPRRDNRGAQCWVQDEDLCGAYTYKLDKITLYAKSNVNGTITLNKIKTADFTYANVGDEVWPGIPNTETADGGKLTLTQLSMNNYDNTRGALNPYKFEYYQSACCDYVPPTDGDPPTDDPSDKDDGDGEVDPPAEAHFDQGTSGLHLDRWGYAQACHDGNECDLLYAPYTRQGDGSTNGSWAMKMDCNVRVNHLESVTLPSGAVLKFKVGRDHYSHVQDQIAGQMFKISGVKNLGGSVIPKNGFTQGQDGRVYFELDEPIDSNDPLAQVELHNLIEDLYEDDQGKQVFFKVMSEYKAGFPKDYIDGYAYLAKDANGSHIVQFDEESIDGDGFYHHAYIELQPLLLPVSKDSKQWDNSKYHPFLVIGWQILKNAYSKILLQTNLSTAQDVSQGEEILNKMENLLDSFMSMFGGYYKNCRADDRCTNIDLSLSYIRLGSPDFLKYGDGIRVREVAMTNIWTHEHVPDYGFVYDYSKTHTVNINGEDYTVNGSSGVAINEPQIGEEENVYKHVINYTDDLKYNTERTIFKESPVNESLMPPASVGYSKVTVKSLASDYFERIEGGQQEHVDIHGIDALMDELSSSGKTEYEFYTARDYPVLFGNTIIDGGEQQKPAKLFYLFGQANLRRYKGSQGYAITTNDMHGKPKSVTSFAQNKDGSFAKNWVKKEEYFYKNLEKTIQRGHKKYAAQTTDNIVDVLVDPNVAVNNYNADIQSAEMGVVRELYTSQEDYSNVSADFGINVAFEGDFTPIVFPLLGFPVWPSFNINIDDIELAKSNKIIHKSGIVDRVRVSDAQSVIETQNLVFDPYSGRPLLTETNDVYDQPKYAYEVPGHTKYTNFEPSSVNWGDEFTGAVSGDESKWSECLNAGHVENVNESSGGKLVVGDILSFEGRDINDEVIRGRAVFLGYGFNFARIQFNDLSREDFKTDPENFKFKCITPYRKNRVNLPAQNITSLSMPTSNENTVYFQHSTKDGGNQNGLEYVPVLNNVLDAKAYIYSDYSVPNLIGQDMLIRGIDHLDYAIPAVEYGEIYNLGYSGIYQLKNVFEPKKNRQNFAGEAYLYSGSLEEFVMFDQDIGNVWNTDLMEYWDMTSDLMGYDVQGQSTSADDISRVHQSTLYNYFIQEDKDGLDKSYVEHYKPTAQCAAAEKFELGFQSFEGYEVDYLYAANQYSGAINAGRIDWFDKYIKDAHEYEIYTVLSPYRADGNKVISMPYKGYDRIFDDTRLCITNNKLSNYIEVRHSLTAIEGQYLVANAWRGQVLSEVNFQLNQPEDCQTGSILDQSEDIVYLALGNHYDTPPGAFLPNPCVEGIAHTGKRSMRLTNVTTWNQQSLRLHHDKDYVFSCWVYNGNTVSDLGDLGVQVVIDQSKPNAVTLSPQGQRIEGWQRIEGVFTGDANNTQELVTTVTIDPGSLNELFVDDVRIYPLGGKMESYVYDARYQRVSHVLDENNYFTEFIYDGEGTLVAINKETTKGIRTIEEQKKYISPTN